MGILTSILHGLAYFGVWILNVIIYELIAIILGVSASGIITALKIKQPLAGKIMGGIAIALFILFCLAALAFWFGWCRIVPLPVFDE